MELPCEFYMKASLLEPDAKYYDDPSYFSGYYAAIHDMMKLINDLEDKRLTNMALKFGDE